jgi:hypothetical protein
MNLTREEIKKYADFLLPGERLSVWDDSVMIDIHKISPTEWEVLENVSREPFEITVTTKGTRFYRTSSGLMPSPGLMPLSTL